MDFMPNVTGWIVVGLRALLFLIPPSILFWLMSEITAHSLYLYGQRTQDGPRGQSTYRFAVQNNEDVALSEHTLSIEILDEDGRFEDGPCVYLGCNGFEPFMDPDHRRWSMTFRELPAYDTWTIDCTMNALAKTVRLEVGEDATRLAGNTLELAAGQQSVLVGRTATEWWWAAGAVSLGLVVYTFSTFLYRGFENGDWWFVSAIVAFTLLLHWSGRLFSPRLAPPVTQGYWNGVRTPFTSEAVAPQGCIREPDCRRQGAALPAKASALPGRVFCRVLCLVDRLVDLLSSLLGRTLLRTCTGRKRDR